MVYNVVRDEVDAEIVRTIPRCISFNTVAEVFPGELSRITRDLETDCDPAIRSLIVRSRLRNCKLRA